MIAYTVPEIDRMRAAARAMFGFACSPDPKEVEERLRTYMLNGTEPEELEQAGKVAWEESIENWRRSHEIERQMREKLTPKARQE